MGMDTAIEPSRRESLVKLHAWISSGIILRLRRRAGYLAPPPVGEPVSP